jgi:hypothetical protein
MTTVVTGFGQGQNATNVAVDLLQVRALLSVQPMMGSTILRCAVETDFVGLENLVQDSVIVVVNQK